MRFAGSARYPRAPSVYSKIEGADGEADTHECDFRDIGIDQPIEKVQQKRALINACSRLPFEKLFGDGQGTRQWGYFDNYSP